MVFGRRHQLKKASKSPTDLVVDSTGLKIFGEGEWKARTHGKQKRRAWRKYHVSVNPNSHKITAVELTEANVHDGPVLSLLLSEQKDLGNIYADGAYSGKKILMLSLLSTVSLLYLSAVEPV